ncbi:MAG: L-2-amino-thiazoline-4-carboxylic acid hydrolase [Candidatus Thorarchaeota archaeon]
MSDGDSTQQLIEHFSAFTEQELVRKFGEKGMPMFRLFQRQFKIHYNNYEHMLPNQLAKKHGMNSLFVMAMDDVMCEVRASFSELKETVVSIYIAMMRDYFSTESEKLKQSEDPWTAFVDWARKGNEANYINDYFQLKEVDQETGCYGFDINRCLYFDILKEAGKPELGPILCEYDQIFMDYVGDWINFTRRETIATGDSRCNFRYCKV